MMYHQNRYIAAVYKILKIIKVAVKIGKNLIELFG